MCSVSPGAESCNSADDDCDGATDEGTTVQCWVDADGDGYAAAGASSTVGCSCPSGTTTRDPSVAGNADCADSATARNPGATEACNRVDDDCDGAVDDGLPTVTTYVDTDGDMRRGTPLVRCAAPGDATGARGAFFARGYALSRWCEMGAS